MTSRAGQAKAVALSPETNPEHLKLLTNRQEDYCKKAGQSSGDVNEKCNLKVWLNKEGLELRGTSEIIKSSSFRHHSD